MCFDLANHTNRWGNSLLAFIALALSPISWILYRYGEKIRKAEKVKF
jgi:hypothetical protein